MKVTHTVSGIVQATPQAGSTATTTTAKLFTDIKPGDVIHIANTDATGILYVKWCLPNETPTVTATNFYEKIPAGESRQFQFKTPNINPAKTLEIWILGDEASTTYNAVQMR